MQDEVLYVELPSQLKYRLDMTVLLEKTTLKNKVIAILDEALPKYEPIKI